VFCAFVAEKILIYPIFLPDWLIKTVEA